MKALCSLSLCVGVVLAWGYAGEDKDKKVDKKDKDAVKKVEKPPVAAPLHPLDPAFEKVSRERDIYDALLNNKHYQKAVAEAFKAGREQAEKLKKNPDLKDVSPGQAARRRFLEVLASDKSSDK